MTKRTALAYPLLLATLVLGLGAIASWVLSGGADGVAPLSLVEAREPGPQESTPAVPPLAEPTSLSEPELPNAAELRVEPAELPDGERTPIVETELEEAHWVEGRMLFPADTPPGEEVEIVAAGRQFEHRELHRAAVAPDGSFRVAFSAKTRYGRLQLHAPHLYLEESESLKLSSIHGPVHLEPKLGGYIRGVVVPPPGVMDAREKLEEELVRLHCWSGTTHEGVQRTGKVDESLRFELRGIPSGQSYVLEFDPGCWAPVEREDLRVTAGQTQEVELRPSLGARVTCRVVDETGAGVKDARVFARIERKTPGGISNETREAELGQDGTYAIEGIAPSEATLVAEKKGFVDAELDLGEVLDGDVREGVELRLLLGHSLAGRVVWPDGTPVADASVRVVEEKSREPWMGAWDGYTRETHKSASDGSFLVTGLGPGPFTVSAQAAKEIVPEVAAEGEPRKKRPKKGPPWHVEFEHVRASESPLVLTLQPGLAVAGRVVDDTGTGVTRFTVTATKVERTVPVFLSEGGVTSKKFESEDGGFVLEGLRDGEWEIRARASGFVESVASKITVPGDGEQLTIVLARAATLSGTVVDPAGRPVERARVRADVDSRQRAFSSWNDDGEYADSTDDQGRFEIDAAPIGKVQLVASHDGFAASEPLSVEVAPNTVLAGLSIQLRQGGRLTGELLSGAGARVDGRQISLHSREGGEWRQTSTDAAGKFALENLVPGKYEVTAEPGEEELTALGDDQDESYWMDRQSLEKSAALSIQDGETTHVVLGAPPRAPVLVSGTVRCGTRPVEGAQILTWKHSSTGEQQHRTAKTGADGGYQLTLDEPGKYSFNLRSPSGRTQFSRNESIPEAPSYALDFELPSGRISGRVLDRDGAPLAGIRVATQVDRTEAEKRSDGIHGWSETDADGRFAFLDLPAGSYTVTVGGEPRFESFGTEPRYGRVEQSGLVLKEGGAIAGLSFELSEAAALEGIVRTASGAPAVGAAITVWNERGQPRETWSAHHTDGTGHYRVSGLAPGSWSVSARLESEVADTISSVRLRPGEEAELDVALRPGTLLRVVIVDATGTPVGAAISVRDERGREHGWMRNMREEDSATGDRPGTIIGPLAPGPYRVTATNHDGVTATQDVSVHGQAELETCVTLGG